MPRAKVARSSADAPRAARRDHDRSRRPEQALQLAHTCDPDLIVLDADSDPELHGTPTNDLRERPAATTRQSLFSANCGSCTASLGSGQIVTKPYHYGPLIRKIDSLLAAA